MYTGGMMFAAGAVIFVVIFALLICAAIYVVGALATKRVLDYFGHPRSWGAWIPIYNMICLTECIDADADGNIDVLSLKVPKKWAIYWPLISLLSAVIAVLAPVIALAVVFCNFIVYKALLEQESGTDELALSIVSALIGIVWWVLCFIIFKGKYVKKDDVYIIEE